MMTFRRHLISWCIYTRQTEKAAINWNISLFLSVYVNKSHYLKTEVNFTSHVRQQASVSHEQRRHETQANRTNKHFVKWKLQVKLENNLQQTENPELLLSCQYLFEDNGEHLFVPIATKWLAQGTEIYYALVFIDKGSINGDEQLLMKDSFKVPQW